MHQAMLKGLELTDGTAKRLSVSSILNCELLSAAADARCYRCGV
jgi:hypothetical protein